MDWQHKKDGVRDMELRQATDATEDQVKWKHYATMSLSAAGWWMERTRYALRTPVSEMTYTVSSGTLKNSTIPYHTDTWSDQRWISRTNYITCMQTIMGNLTCQDSRELSQNGEDWRHPTSRSSRRITWNLIPVINTGIKPVLIPVLAGIKPVNAR